METERLDGISGPLIRWFVKNARVLPWRAQPGAPPAEPQKRSYEVWVSEIMLQQTRVEAVKPYYLRFMAALPDVAALAACPEDRLLKLWEGLGYYSRVRNMQKAARIVMEQYGGRLPQRYEELLALPGIGSYTAGAVASIAYGQIAPAVDGNVLRVASRITGSREDISRQAVKKSFEELLMRVMEGELQHLCGLTDNLPGAFNQALMELGAMVCLPKGTPDCTGCPAAHLCYAREQGCQTELPVRAARKERKTEQRTVFVIRDTERCAVRRRPARGLLAGLYELPNTAGWLSSEEALARVRGWGFSPVRITQLPQARHIFSHIEWQMAGYLVLVEDTEPGTEEPGDDADGRILLIEPSRTEREYPVPAAFAAYAGYLSIRLGQEKYTGTEGEIR